VSGFPVELAARTYDATITEHPQGERGVSIRGSTVLQFSGFLMYVAGDHVAFEIEWSVAEEVSGFRYLYVGGGAPPTPFTVESSSVRIPFAAEFSYCELKAARGIYNYCLQVPREQVVAIHSCIADRAIMTFTPQ
jgi:hypothetical protein